MVVEANTGKPVGFVCQWLPAPPRWLRWFLPRLHLWEIHEIEDESLLFTMQEWKGLLPFVKRVYWQVGDAEDHSLGTVESRKQSEPSGWISTAAARDPSGQVVVLLERWPGGSESPLIVFQPGAPGNLAELATVSRSRDVLLVEFANTLEGQPFAKMLVLAAVLAAAD